MVDLSRDSKGRTRARLLDLVPGRCGAAYAGWLKERNQTFRAGIKVATLDPFHGYKNANDDELEDAIAVLDAFHVVKLGTAALDEVRRRVQQQTAGHRGRNGDPLHGIQNVLRCGAERLSAVRDGSVMLCAESTWGWAVGDVAESGAGALGKVARAW